MFRFSPLTSLFNFCFLPALSLKCFSNLNFFWKNISFSHNSTSGATIWNKHFNLVLSRQKEIELLVTATVLHPLRSLGLGNWPRILLSFCCKSLSFFMLYLSRFLVCRLQVSPHCRGRWVDVEGMISPCKMLTARQLHKLESWRWNDVCCYIVWLLWIRHGPALLLCFASNSQNYKENKISNILIRDSRACKWYFLPHGCPQGGSSMPTKSLEGLSMQTKSFALTNSQHKLSGILCHQKTRSLFPGKSWAPEVSYGTEHLETCSRIGQKISEDSKLPWGAALAHCWPAALLETWWHKEAQMVTGEKGGWLKRAMKGSALIRHTGLRKKETFP